MYLYGIDTNMYKPLGWYRIYSRCSVEKEWRLGLIYMF